MLLIHSEHAHKYREKGGRYCFREEINCQADCTPEQIDSQTTPSNQWHF